MHRYNLLIAGLFMVGAGAYLIFANPPALPLWFVWLAGPFLWYVGIAVSIVGVALALFVPHAPRQKVWVAEPESQAQMLHMQKFASAAAPAGLVREIPAMGGFIM